MSMKTTESGSIAVGAPMSLARLQQELEYMTSPNGSVDALVKTDEGEKIISKWMQYKGGAGGMTADAYVGGLEWQEVEQLESFLYGALVALRMGMAGRIY